MENVGRAWALLSQHIQAGPLGKWFSRWGVRRQFCPAGDTWPCLETVRVVTMEGADAVGILWVEARNDAKYPTTHRQILKQSEPTWNVNSSKAEQC